MSCQRHVSVTQTTHCILVYVCVCRVSTHVGERCEVRADSDKYNEYEAAGDEASHLGLASLIVLYGASTEGGA